MNNSNDHQIRDLDEFDPKERKTTLSLTPSVVAQIFSWRAVIYLLSLFSFVVLGLPRTTTSMALVCIESRRKDILDLANASGMSLKEDILLGGLGLRDGHHTNNSSNDSDILSVWDVYGKTMRDLNWDSRTRGLVLSGPLFLACLSPIIGDTIRQRIGSRVFLTAALLLVSFIMLISPELARVSPYFLLANQVALGLTLEANTPCVADAVTRWTPVSQRLTVSSLTFTGVNVGGILNTFVNGFLCSVPFDNGWPFVFYAPGLAVFIYAVAWFFLFSNSPETHPFISEKEKTFILSTRSPLINHARDKTERPPYRAILTSVPVWAFVSQSITSMWFLSICFIYVPIYLSSVHGFSAQMTGVLMSAVSFMRFLGGFGWTALGNLLTNRKILSSATTRKTCLCLSLILSACACLTVSMFDRRDKWLAILCFTLTFVFQSVTVGAVPTLPQEMAPRYAGTVISIGFSVAMLVSMSGPLLVASLTRTGTYEEWRVVWMLMSSVFVVAFFIFLIFGSAEIQPWALTPSTREATHQHEDSIATVSGHLQAWEKTTFPTELVSFDRQSPEHPEGVMKMVEENGRFGSTVTGSTMKLLSPEDLTEESFRGHKNHLGGTEVEEMEERRAIARTYQETAFAPGKAHVSNTDNSDCTLDHHCDLEVTRL